MRVLSSLTDMPKRLVATYFVLFAAISCLNYWPVFTGRIPFPSEVIRQFPEFEPLRDSNFYIQQHAVLCKLVTLFYMCLWYAANSIRHGVVLLWDSLVLS